MEENSNKVAIILFDCNLRIKDNPAFFAALNSSKRILPLFILDETNKRKFGGASKWFLHHALENLKTELKKEYSLDLILKKGDSLEILGDIFKNPQVFAIYLDRLCEPYNIKLQNNIKNLANKNSVEFFDFKAQTLFDFDEIKTLAGGYFKVFTPFFNNCKKNFNKIENLLKKPKNNGFLSEKLGLKSENLELLPKKSWADNFKDFWEFDYKKIDKNLDKFLEEKVDSYKENRNFPAQNATSAISPYLAFGLISVREVFFKIQNLISINGNNEGIEQFLAEICWREFCHHLIFHFPNLPKKSFQEKFDNFPWVEDKISLKKWQKGQTGYPLVDAGMRQLWATGTMHNRIRMVVASFLVKHLLIDWKQGEKWFWDCLMDANLANNVANWQWVAGSGADAAPYFRIFNPSLQAQRFDKEANYIRKWVPELKNLPNKLIFEPWKLDSKTLEYYKIELGKTYPKPIVNHESARDMALMIYKNL